ncbi:MAG: phage tail tape measure protein [Candidatus Anammoxibacter sp.]
MVDPKIIIRIAGDSKKFRKELDRVEKDTSASVRRMQKAAKIAAAGFVVLAVGAGFAFKQFADFEQKFTDVITLLDKGSFSTKTLNEGIDGLRDGVLKLRRETGESFDNLNKGLFDLISAGIDAEEAIDVLRVATELALAGATNTAVAVDGLTSAMNAFGLEADQAESVSAKFFTAQKGGKTTIEELSRGFGKVGASAAAFGVSLNETLAAVSAVTLGGVKTSEAFTGLAAVFANIVAPSARAIQEAKDLGIEFTTTALRAKGLTVFFNEIMDSSDFTSTSLENLFGSIEASKFVFGLAGGQAESYSEILGNLNDETQSALTLQEALAVKTNTAAQRMRLLKGGVDAAAVSIGSNLAPAILFFAEFTSDALSDAIKAFKLMGEVISGLKIIAEESFNFILLQILKFDRAFARVLDGSRKKLEDFINKIPGLDIDFGLDDPQRLAALKKLDEEIAKRELRAKAFFGEQFGPPISEEDLALIAQKKKEETARESLQEHLEKLAEIEETARQEKADKDQAVQDSKDEKEQEKFDREAESLVQRLQKATKVKDVFAGQDLIRDLLKLKNRAKNAKDLAKVDEQLSIAQQQFSTEALTTQLLNLDTLFGMETAVGKAIFIVRKAQAIAAVIVSTQESMALARATLLFPFSESVATRYAIAGAINVAIIAGTAIQTLSAQEGGIVPGGFGGGDRVPFLLEPGELIVPQNLNPLSPNFEDLGGGGGQEVVVKIELTDEASQFITVGQREDTTLGVQR